VSGLVTDTVAVKVTVWPATAGLELEVTAVVVGAFTVSVIVFEVSESPVTVMPTKP
jgi:hypothetical protein